MYLHCSTHVLHNVYVRVRIWFYVMHYALHHVMCMYKDGFMYRMWV
jgi:hypothetical protein